MGADVTLNFRNVDVVDEVMKLTGGRVPTAPSRPWARRHTFAQAMKVLKPGGTLSSLGVLGRPVDPAGAVCCWPGRPHHHARRCARRQGAHAPADERDRIRESLDLGALVTHQRS